MHTCHNLKWFVIKFQVQKEILTATTKQGKENVPKIIRDICVFAIGNKWRVEKITKRQTWFNKKWVFFLVERESKIKHTQIIMTNDSGAEHVYTLLWENPFRCASNERISENIFKQESVRAYVKKERKPLTNDEKRRHSISPDFFFLKFFFCY